jgi:hypothetical protein
MDYNCIPLFLSHFSLFVPYFTSVLGRYYDCGRRGKYGKWGCKDHLKEFTQDVCKISGFL